MICLFVLLALSLVMTGCKVKAYGNKLECCGTATRYSDGKLEVSGCSYFTCTKQTGRWNKITGGYYFYTTDGLHSAVGQTSGDVMIIEVLD
ncbi:hypothetical protein Clocl_3181 [Acetivibrio clariflavus DSM 19732]|uniref:Uncharacterized protein n=2 Tax=Acetivibrio clariflavus TaxID=288965 RepID=G8LVR7_ACECE|nr:hypothetical protein Clocl_3181 [Acetivibrio clariflavus DSM 19732]